MNLILAGEATRMPCEHCLGLQPATYRYSEFKFDDGMTVPKVLQAFCDTCGHPVGIAQQSTSHIGSYRSQRKPTSVRIPPVLTDLASSLLAQAGGDTERAPEIILKIALAATLDEDRTSLANKLKKAKGSPLLSQPATTKFTLNLRPLLSQRLRDLQNATPLRSQSEAVKAFLVLAGDELKIQEQIRRFALIT